MDQGDKIRHAIGTQGGEHRKVVVFAFSKIDPKEIELSFQHVIKRAFPPLLSGFAFVAAAIFDDERFIALIAAPAESTAFIDRMERIDEKDGPR